MSLQRFVGLGRAVLALLPFLLQPATAVDGEAGFRVRVDGEVIPYEVFGVYVLPGSVVKVELLESPRASRFELRTGGRVLRPDRAGAWSWRAPQQPGLQSLDLRRLDASGAMTLHVFVLVPATRMQAGVLNSYRIGAYPQRPPQGDGPPQGYVEVTPENRDVRVSPRFTLGQFLCKQEGDFPKYVVLRERMLLALEHLWMAANARGWRCETFHIMSGYRTPAYNDSIGNVTYSRHLWGTAADIFIDASPQDGRMDDLNGDGRSDKADADALYDFFEAVAAQADFAPFEGGLGCYDGTAAHGPFVHVDVRGTRARWGR